MKAAGAARNLPGLATSSSGWKNAEGAISARYGLCLAGCGSGIGRPKRSAASEDGAAAADIGRDCSEGVGCRHLGRTPGDAE